MVTADLSREISAFFKQRVRLMGEFGPSWVVFVDDELKGHFSTFDEAARYALANFTSERFLIRHTSDPEPQIPMLVVEE